MKALGLSVLLHAAFICAYYEFGYFAHEGEGTIPRVRIVKYSDLGPPPSLTSVAQIPAVGVRASARKPTLGIPVPVPDFEINPERNFPTQQELSNSGTIGTGDGTGGGLEDGAASADNSTVNQDIRIEEDDPAMDAFVAVEKPPVIVVSAQPVYPEFARRAGVSGVVWVKVLVGKDGRPKRAVVLKEEAGGLFNESAIGAAMQYVFTPAVMSSGPVSVWVTLKFRFQLKGESS